MISREIIEATKREFIRKYGSKSPIDAGILASVQHGYLYSPNCSDKDRRKIKELWASILNEKIGKYRSRQCLDDFIKDIEEIKNRMNAAFESSFQNDDPRYEKGFRIAHAQKSLSIALKHQWCLGKIPIPPICPIDGIILKSVKSSDSWTKINNVESYKKHVELVKKTAIDSNEFETASEWELITFSNGTGMRTGESNAPAPSFLTGTTTGLPIKLIQNGNGFYIRELAKNHIDSDTVSKVTLVVGNHSRTLEGKYKNILSGRLFNREFNKMLSGYDTSVAATLRVIDREVIISLQV